jgi:hypothetical protein
MKNNLHNIFYILGFGGLYTGEPAGAVLLLVIGAMIHSLNKKTNCQWCNRLIDDKKRYSLTHCSKSCEMQDKNS